MQDPLVERVGPPSGKRAYLALISSCIRRNIRRRRIFWTMMSAALCSMPIAFIFRAIMPQMQGDQDRAQLALVFAWLVPMELLFGVMSVFSSTLAELVLDRESKLKAIQFMYGLQPSTYWCAWISYMAIISAVCSVIYSLAFFVVAPVFGESSKILVFAVFLFGHLQVCAVSCLFSTFFNKVKTAATCGSLVLTVLNLLSL